LCRKMQFFAPTGRVVCRNYMDVGVSVNLLLYLLASNSY
jgi:hypothetical protein